MKNYSNEIAELEAQITEAKREQRLLEESNNEKVQNVLDYYFNYFKEMEVKVRGTYATFHLKDEEGYNKEIFSLYFDERYQQEATLRISYYSTSTNSDFEIERLILIGKAAQVIKRSSEVILSTIKDTRKLDLEKTNELFSNQLKYENQIKDYRNSELQERKAQIELELKNGGVTFEVPREIKFKFNYVIYVKFLKIIDISKSGKTCTVIFKTRDGFETREENCNIQNVIDQVTSLHKSIVSTLELV
jgi:hypothetical protein